MKTMRTSGSGRAALRAFTLIELLCTIAIIAVLATLLLGSAGRVLKRIRADAWGDRASAELELVKGQLRQRFQGRTDFPTVTLEQLEAEGILQPPQVSFLHDSRVGFASFSGTDPAGLVVVVVQIPHGFFTDAGSRILTKGEIVAPSQ
jgi:prepilin-type N-terminal cleavage/methylation domain-containing protein